MLYEYFNKNLLGLQGVTPIKSEKIGEVLHIYLETERTAHKCPSCGEETDKVHDYRWQEVRDVPGYEGKTVLHIRKRRYACPHCGKRFGEKLDFLPKYYRMTTRLAFWVIDKLTEVRSYTSVAREIELSVTTILRIFDHVAYPKPTLPTALAIDEFKGNAGGEKYQCILTDPLNHRVLDILPARSNSDLTAYFRGYPAKERENIDFFISDMWRPYFDIANVFCKDAVQIVDKFHWIRQVVWAFESVRKEVQKKFSATHRRYFKRSRFLLLKPYHTLEPDDKRQVNIMLDTSADLSTAHFLKESFFQAIYGKTSKDDFAKWIRQASASTLKAFSKCARTFTTWYTGILNSFDYTLTNGFTEGCNNKIKVLKRNAYGLRNFTRFRKRILHIFSYQR